MRTGAQLWWCENCCAAVLVYARLGRTGTQARLLGSTPGGHLLRLQVALLRRQRCCDALQEWRGRRRRQQLRHASRGGGQGARRERGRCRAVWGTAPGSALILLHIARATKEGSPHVGNLHGHRNDNFIPILQPAPPDPGPQTGSATCKPTCCSKPSMGS